MRSNRKLLFLIRSLGVGGAEHQLLHLAVGLSKLGYDVAVAVFYGNGLLEKDLQDVGVPIIYLRKSGRWDVFLFLFRLVRSVIRFRPDFIYSFI